MNGHVTFVARVSGQIARVFVDNNNRVYKGRGSRRVGKEPYEDAVAVKRFSKPRSIQWRSMVEKQGARKDESIRNDASVILAT